MKPVVIIGGGPVGMSLALALHKLGVAAEIHDLRPRGAAAGDQRILALSHGSQQILAGLGVWADIKATSILNIHVSQRGAAGRTKISAREEGLDALGYVAASSRIATALDQALNAANISYVGDSRLLESRPGDDSIALDCSDGELTTQLVAYAEGRIGDAEHVIERDYGQHALICRLTPVSPHQGTAWERFTSHGPFALLPHEGDYAAVYTCAPAEAERLKTLPDHELLAHLQSEFGPRVQFNAVHNRFIYPLGLRYRQQPTAPRQVWLGNAAQTLHPVAGQGFNLALRDCMALAHCLSGAADPGAPEVLVRYAASRKLDRCGTIGITDSLIRVFSNDNPLLKHARGAGLIALDMLPPLRSFLARRMMFGARAW
jgi:2-octaprenyl-6-methoxyphenol hydroxylase